MEKSKRGREHVHRTFLGTRCSDRSLSAQGQAIRGKIPIPRDWRDSAASKRPSLRVFFGNAEWTYVRAYRSREDSRRVKISGLASDLQATGVVELIIGVRQTLRRPHGVHRRRMLHGAIRPRPVPEESEGFEIRREKRRKSEC